MLVFARGECLIRTRLYYSFSLAKQTREGMPQLKAQKPRLLSEPSNAPSTMRFRVKCAHAEESATKHEMPKRLPK
jgi:hypothetical protein